MLATASEHKAREIDAILRAAGADVELVPRPPDVPDVEESGVTFEDNARLKAVALCEATGLPALADDTGLEVAVLGGAPGVHSGRFAGDHDTDRNIAKLLELLHGVPEDERSARFVTVAIARFVDGREVAAFGEVAGRIVAEDRAGPAGFGYDRVFVPSEGDGRTFAEMSADEKHEISHRGRAFRTLADGLRIMDAIERE
ncbi:MAG: RdgB/HAM1 family non-canonical purine NTP pyrophosphatase [Acidimicrobiia bacterium]